MPVAVPVARERLAGFAGNTAALGMAGWELVSRVRNSYAILVVGSSSLARREEGEYLDGIQPTSNVARGDEDRRDCIGISDAGH